MNKTHKKWKRSIIIQAGRANQIEEHIHGPLHVFQEIINQTLSIFIAMAFFSSDSYPSSFILGCLSGSFAHRATTLIACWTQFSSKFPLSFGLIRSGCCQVHPATLLVHPAFYQNANFSLSLFSLNWQRCVYYFTSQALFLSFLFGFCRSWWFCKC